MPYNDSKFSVFWCRGSGVKNPPGATAVSVGKHVAEDTQALREDETLGVIVLESGSGRVGDYAFEAALGADSVRGVGNGAYTYALGTQAPVTAILSKAGMDGHNGGWTVLNAGGPLFPGELLMAIDEDQICDNERSHTTEQVGYVVFETI